MQHCFSMIFLYFLSGQVILLSLLIGLIEQWTFLETLYFCSISVTTVGYGDLFPLTIAGRFVSVVAGIVGIIVAAFATAALCRNLALSNSEFKTKNLIGRGDMDRSISSSAATYIQRYFRFKWNRPAPDASFWNPAIDMLSAANEFTAAKREYEVWLKVRVFVFLQLWHVTRLFVRRIKWIWLSVWREC